MISLKQFAEHIARVAGMTTAAVYERQRVLVRAGLLQSEGGRGPGSGTRASPESVAMLLVSLISSASLSDTEEQTRIVSRLKNQEGKCSLTGKTTFADAVSEIVRSESLVKKVHFIQVAQETLVAGISYATDPNWLVHDWSEFRRQKKPESPGLSTECRLHGWALRDLHKRLEVYRGLKK